MVHLYIDSVLAGLVATNGLPHFIKGIMGKSHKTPFDKNSSAVVNVTWGWLNLAVGGVLLYFAHPRAHYLRAGACFAAASLVMSLLLASTWSKQAKK